MNGFRTGGGFLPAEFCSIFRSIDFPLDRFFRKDAKVRSYRHPGFGILFPALKDLLVPVGSFQEECKIFCLDLFSGT